MNFITDINKLDPSKKYSYADYFFWQFKKKVKWIKEKLLMMSSSTVQSHQSVLGNIYISFRNYLNQKTRELFFSPFDVVLNKGKNLKDTVKSKDVQPDICVICDQFKLADGKKCVGAPDLIVEILSPATNKYDYSDKFNYYEENKVKEYWIRSSQ